jgi:osmotically-inducible protein OsmY
METTSARERDLVARLAGRQGFERVEVIVQDEKAILEGCVPSYALKRRAEEIAHEAGFDDVDNCLRICEEEGT